MADEPVRVVAIERGLVLALDTAVALRQVLRVMFEGEHVGAPLDADAQECATNCIKHLEAVEKEVAALKAKRVLLVASPSGRMH